MIPGITKSCSCIVFIYPDSMVLRFQILTNVLPAPVLMEEFVLMELIDLLVSVFPDGVEIYVKLVSSLYSIITTRTLCNV